MTLDLPFPTKDVSPVGWLFAGDAAELCPKLDPAVRFDLDLSPEEMRGWYSPRADFKKRGFCLAQWKGLWIGPGGEVITCQPLGYEMGSVRAKPALEVFNGPGFKKFRAALLKSGGYLPTCSRCGRTSYTSVPSKERVR